MQALTIAIGPAGITYFTKQLVAGELIQFLSGLKLQDRSLSVPDFGLPNDRYSQITISLSNGALNGFSPGFQSVTQQAGGQFQVILLSTNFSTNYSWHETDTWHYCYTDPSGFPHCHDAPQDKSFDYRCGIGGFTVTVELSFVYDQSSQSYDIEVNSSGQTANVSPNIPAGSVIQYEDTECFSNHLIDATANAIKSIDFSTPISTIIPPLLHSIPASGQLTPDIRYEFGLGDAGLTYPNDQGIAIGATGRVSYKGQYYPGTPPAPLPLPPAPTDTHHLQVYVSAYEVNALHWAFFQAGLLNVTVQPADLPDPDVLKVKTYVSLIPAFKPYAAFAMQAQVNPKQPPVVAFQEVYEFTAAVMQLLQQQLPADVYQKISGLDGNAYVSAADLEVDLAAAGVPQTYYQTIEKAARSMGMAVTHDLEFTLTIENGANPAPNLVFDVARTDILQNLGLGVSGKAQTLQYAFMRVKAAATFVSTTIPKFDRKDFGDTIWPVAGEPRYDDILQKMGQTGVPLPIMAGFQFLFEQAQLSIQQGYVSILAQVAFKGTTLLKGDSHERDRRTVRR